MPNNRNDSRRREGGELRSVGSPGIGGGTGGQADRDPSERDRGGDEPRFERGGEGREPVRQGDRRDERKDDDEPGEDRPRKD